MLDTSVLKSLLQSEFFEQNREKLSRQLFSDDIRELYEVIVSAQDQYNHDLNEHELLTLWKLKNPVATRAETAEIEDLVAEVGKSTPISQDIAQETIERLWRRQIGNDAATLGLRMSEDDYDAMSKLATLVERHRDGYLPNDLGEPTTLNITEILAQRKIDGVLEFNLETLKRRIPGVPKKKFGIIFATPETGKTAFVLSLALAPGGYVDQGFKVLIIGNEEATTDTIERAYGTCLGMKQDQIAEDPDKVEIIFNAKVKDKFVVYDAQDWDVTRLEACIAKEAADVVFIDQLDKIGVSGTFQATHEKLGEIYRRTREAAKRHNCLIWGVSQASNDATGKTRITYDMLAGSKINKAAEADIILGLGKHAPTSEEEGEEDPTRFITASKNKVSGWHGRIVCSLHGEVSRYVE